jgi:hypothetical protein
MKLLGLAILLFSLACTRERVEPQPETQAVYETYSLTVRGPSEVTLSVVLDDEHGRWSVDWEGKGEFLDSSRSSDQASLSFHFKKSGKHQVQLRFDKDSSITELHSDRGAWELDFEELPESLTNLVITGSESRIRGKLVDLPRGLTHLELSSETEMLISGELADLPPGLITFDLDGDNTTSGDLEDLPSTLTWYSNKGQNTVTVTSASWTLATENFRLFRQHGVGLDEASVDLALEALLEVQNWAEPARVDLAGDNDPPGADGLDHKADLEQENVTVLVN